MTATATETQWTPERIRQLRERLQLTLYDAARKVGVQPRTWLSWEQPSQKRTPPASRRMLLDLLDAGDI